MSFCFRPSSFWQHVQAVDVWVVKPRDKQRSPAVQIPLAARDDFRHTDSCVLCLGVLMLLIPPGNMTGQLVMRFVPAYPRKAPYHNRRSATEMQPLTTPKGLCWVVTKC